MNGKILIVDDSPTDTLFIKKIMKSSEFEFDSVMSNKEARDYLKENIPMAIILDYLLPDGDSMTIIDQFHNNFPIVLLTGMEDPEIGLKAVKKGAQDFLTKGFINKNLLVKSIKYSIERQSLKRRVSSAEKMASLGRMSSGVAHEMNTPIQYVSDNLYFLEKEFKDILERMKQIKALSQTLDGDEYKKSLTEIISGADLNFLDCEIPAAVKQSLQGMEKISRLVKALKNYASNETTEVKKIDINEVLKYSLEKFVGTSNNVQVELDLLSDLKRLLAEERNLTQVFDHIFENAYFELERKFSQGAEKGLLRVRTEQNEHAILIKISDNGDGIPEDIIEHIFDPFFTTKTFEGNLGQGLAIVHRVIYEELYGTLNVNSQPGQGAKFTISIPFLKTN